MKSNDIQTNPPLRTRLRVHFNKSRYEKMKKYLDAIPDGMQTILDFGNCEVDLSTGRHDIDGKEIYGGDVMQSEHGMYVISWDNEAMTWIVVDPECGTKCGCLNGYAFAEDKVIGNVRNPAGLPEEVRRMLDE